MSNDKETKETKETNNKLSTLNNGLPIIEKDGVYYFKDEADVGNFNNPIYF